MSQTRTHSGVLTVGPDYHARGGIASVLEVYSRTIPGFTFLPTNSRRGKVAGYLNLLSTMVRMPFYRMRGYGILHAHGACGKSFVRKAMVMAWGRALGFRTIFHAHGGGFPAYAAKIGEDRARAVLGKCSAIAVLARSWVPYYRDVMRHSRVVVVENIIDAPARLPERLPSAELRLLFLGKLCRDKGIYDLLEALAAHKDEFAGRVSLRVGGVGETDIFLERVRSLGLESMVDYVGWVDGEAKRRYLNDADVMILPSYYEGMPICLLEGSAYGHPSIASPVGSIPELVRHGETGLIVEPGSSDSIASAIRHYLDFPDDLERHGKAALREVAPHLPDHVAQQLESLYRSI